MTSVQDHYDRHLGPVYAWMVGGIESAIERGAAEKENLEITPSENGVAKASNFPLNELFNP